MSAGASSFSPRLKEILSTRVPMGFGDQIREAARVVGVRPGTLIRTAIAERIERAGVPPTMTPENRAELVGALGEGFVRNVERSTVDAEFCAQLEREAEAARFRFMDRIIAAHGHLSAYIAGRSARTPGRSIADADISESADHLRLAFAEMSAAGAIEEDLGRLVMGGEA